MILNVSGRTDVVAFYTEWFMNRYNAGFLDVRNPISPKLVNRIYFKDVDAIIFCTKNPRPIIKYLDKIDKKMLFHITLTPYKKDLEPNVIGKGNIINDIKKVSDIVGIDNIYIRYDPILINDKYNINYHINAFNHMCNLLNGYVKHIIISFIDEYKNTKKNKNILKNKELTKEDLKKIGTNFSKIAKNNNMTVQTCCENDYTEYGFIKEDCISPNLAFKLTGKTNFKKWKSRSCNCVNMVDIGVYNTCPHFCKYCYANYDENKVLKNIKNHVPSSTFLIGKSNYDDIIKVRK